MRYKFLTVVLFAVFIFLIPLLALEQTPLPMQAVPSNHSSVPLEVPPPTPAVIPEKSPQIPTSTPETPILTLADKDFRILDERTGTVFSVDTQSYVRGALAAEMPPNFHPEALKAQAVASHTYALCLQDQHRQTPEPDLKGADFSADPTDWKGYVTEAIFRERYGDYADAYWKTICTAADAVTSYLLTDEGKPIIAAYHSMSSGMTEDAANVWLGGRSYLIPVESFGDTLAPDFSTTVTIPVEKVSALLKKAYPKLTFSGEPTAWLKINTRSQGGYVLQLTAGNQTLSGKELRSLLELRSSNFEITCDGVNFIFTVKGYGHGVGFSQYGADYMARQGSTFDEILLHYYTGVSLVMIAPLP